MHTMVLPKSIWEGVSLRNARDQENIKSWFCLVVSDHATVVRANVLTRTRDDKTLKIRALVREPDGTERELVRTMGARFTVTIKQPTKQRWA